MIGFVPQGTRVSTRFLRFRWCAEKVHRAVFRVLGGVFYRTPESETRPATLMIGDGQVEVSSDAVHFPVRFCNDQCQ